MEERGHSRYTIFEWSRDRHNNPCLTPLAGAETPTELRMKLQRLADRQPLNLGNIIVNYPPIEGIVLDSENQVTLPEGLDSQQ